MTFCLVGASWLLWLSFCRTRLPGGHSPAWVPVRYCRDATSGPLCSGFLVRSVSWSSLLWICFFFRLLLFSTWESRRLGGFCFEFLSATAFYISAPMSWHAFSTCMFVLLVWLLGGDSCSGYPILSDSSVAKYTSVHLVGSRSESLCFGLLLAWLAYF